MLHVICRMKWVRNSCCIKRLPNTVWWGQWSPETPLAELYYTYLLNCLFNWWTQGAADSPPPMPTGGGGGMQHQPTAERMHPYVRPGAPPGHDWTSNLFSLWSSLANFSYVTPRSEKIRENWRVLHAAIVEIPPACKRVADGLMSYYKRFSNTLLSYSAVFIPTKAYPTKADLFLCERLL